MLDGPIPHVGGVVLETTADNILIGMGGIMPAATIGSMAMCIGPPANIVDGSPSFIADCDPVAIMLSSTDHGGMVLEGEPNVLV